MTHLYISAPLSRAFILPHSPSSNAYYTQKRRDTHTKWLVKYFSCFDCCINIIYRSRLNFTNDLHTLHLLSLHTLIMTYCFISRTNTIIILSPWWIDKLSINKQLVGKLQCPSISFDSYLTQKHNQHIKSISLTGSYSNWDSWPPPLLLITTSFTNSVNLIFS